jgi:hypothetical protein
MKDMVELQHFLNIHVTRDKNGIYLDQCTLRRCWRSLVIC